MAAAHTFTVHQGETTPFDITWTINDVPVDLTGWAAEFRVSTSPTLVVTDGAGIEIDGPAGHVVVELSAAQTAEFTRSNYEFNLDLTAPGGEVTRLLRGKLEVVEAVPG